MSSPTHRDFGVARQQFLDAVTNYVCQSDVSSEIIEAGVVDDLLPLLKDPSVVTQRYVAEFLGRFAEKGVNESECILQMGGVQMLLNRFPKREIQFKRTAIYTLTSIGRHSNDLTKKIVRLGAFDAICHCLESPNVELNTDAMYALRLLGTHPIFASCIIKEDIAPLVNKCLYSYDTILIEWTLFSIGEIVNENKELAEYIASEGFLDVIYQQLIKPCKSIHVNKFKIWILHVWSSFASHNADLANNVMEPEIIPFLKDCLLYGNDDIRDKVLYTLTQIVKHSAKHAMSLIEEDILDILLNIADSVSIEQGCMSLDLVGIIASLSAIAAYKITEHPIARAMTTFVKHAKPKVSEVQLIASCIWALGQIGKHSPGLANRLAQFRVVNAMIDLYKDKKLPVELLDTCKATLKQLLQKCSNVHILDHFILDVPEEIQEYVIHGLANLITVDKAAKAALIECGALVKIVYIPIKPGTDLMEDVLKIVYAYPDSVISRLRDGPQQNQDQANGDQAETKEKRKTSVKKRTGSRKGTKGNL